MNKIFKITHSGELKIGNINIPCFVTEEGIRILSSRGMQDALKIVDEAEEGKQRPGTRLRRFFGYNALKPFIYKDKEQDHFRPIVCYKGKTKINGYEATTLADICDAVLEARKQGVKFTSRQEIIAIQCEILVRSFAKIGIIALIDEATGYQEIRNREALQKILDKVLLKEYAKWAKRFPDSFYKEMFRLNNWQYNPMTTKRPGVIGKYTNNVVYERLAPGVLEELKKLNPKDEKGHRKVRHHQWLTEDVGHPKLQEHLIGVDALMKATSNWRNFIRLLERVYPKIGNTIPINYEEEIE